MKWAAASGRGDGGGPGPRSGASALGGGGGGGGPGAEDGAVACKHGRPASSETTGTSNRLQCRAGSESAPRSTLPGNDPPPLLCLGRRGWLAGRAVSSGTFSGAAHGIRSSVRVSVPLGTETPRTTTVSVCKPCEPRNQPPFMRPSPDYIAHARI